MSVLIGNEAALEKKKERKKGRKTFCLCSAVVKMYSRLSSLSLRCVAVERGTFFFFFF